MFATFQTLGDRSLIASRDAALAFTLAMCSENTPGYWLTLLGPSGTGKTMLAKIVDRIFQRHLEGIYLDEVRTKRGPDGGYSSKAWRSGGFKYWPDAVGEMLNGDYTGLPQLRSDWFVSLDDIGAEHSKTREFSAAKLTEVLNAREGRFTFLTANLDLQSIAEKMDARISSRLLRHGNQVVDVATTDWNMRG